jgi:diacylglycerol O-acyltransferase
MAPPRPRPTVGSMRLNGMDGTFVELEDGDASAHMHIGALLVFDARADGSVPSLDDLADHLAGRLQALPLYHRRLAGPATGMRWPEWVEDDHFDVRHHLRRVGLPAPGGWEELLEWGGDYFSRRLDRSLPLWDMVLVEGLADGHWALATKTHHSLCDGVGAVDVAHLLFDVEPVDVPEVAPEDLAGREDDDAHEAWRPPGFAIAKASLGAVVHPKRTLNLAAALAELLVRDELIAAPDLSINGPIGPFRRLHSVRLDLAEAKAVKAALGGTVNDVALAAVTGGLRALLLARGEALPERGVRAMVPMDIRRDDEHDGRLGNRISSLFVDLPVAEEDELQRHGLVCAATDQVKASHLPEGADALLALAGLAPPLLHHQVARSLFAKRLFNLTVTNVPGPQQQLYVLGAPLHTVWPLVPLAAEHAVGVAVVSYAGALTFGIVADRDSMGDLDVMVDGMVQTLRVLQATAHGVAHPEVAG